MLPELLPPAKKFTPPPTASRTVKSGKPPGEPYWTAVSAPLVIHDGGGLTVDASVEPGPSSAPGLSTRLPDGIAAPARSVSTSQPAVTASTAATATRRATGRIRAPACSRGTTVRE